MSLDETCHVPTKLGSENMTMVIVTSKLKYFMHMQVHVYMSNAGSLE